MMVSRQSHSGLAIKGPPLSPSTASKMPQPYSRLVMIVVRRQKLTSPVRNGWEEGGGGGGRGGCEELEETDTPTDKGGRTDGRTDRQTYQDETIDMQVASQADRHADRLTNGNRWTDK